MPEMTGALLGGIELIATRPISFGMTTGLSPVITVVESDSHALHQLVGLKTTLEMTNTVAGGTVRYENVIVIGRSEPSQPDLFAVVITDIRWLLDRTLISRRYNITRRRGVREVQTDDGWNTVAVASNDDLRYELDSIKGAGDDLDEVAVAGVALGPAGVEVSDNQPGAAAPWKPSEMLADVLDEASRRLGFSYKIDLGNLTSEKIQTNVIIEGDPRSAINRILNLIPFASVYVNRKGVLTIFDETRVDLASEEISRLTSTVAGGGLLYSTDNAFLAPRHINVLFPREMAVRFDYSNIKQEELKTEFATTEDQYLENVFQVTDLNLEVGGDYGTYGRGSFVPYNTTVFAKLGTPLAGAMPTISDRVIRQFYWWNFLSTLYAPWGEFLDPTNDWAGRCSSLLHHYRSTFRLPRRWVDLTGQVSARLTQLLDNVTRTYNVSPVWCDWSTELSLRGVQYAKTVADGNKVHYHYNTTVDLVADDNGTDIVDIGNSRTCPASVSIVDGNAGIIRVNYGNDPLRNYTLVIPGNYNFRPTLTPAGETVRTDELFPETESDINNNTSKAKNFVLQEDFELATILTLTPIYPNNNSKYHTIRVTPEDVRRAVVARQTKAQFGDAGPQGPIIGGPPIPQKLSLEAKGPPIDFKIDYFPARFKWDQTHRNLTRKAFGLDGGIDDPAQFSGQLADALIVDEDHKQEIQDIAIASAEAIYVALQDRLAGRKTDKLNNTITIAGNLTSITDTVSLDGSVLTSIQADPTTPIPDPIGLLPIQVQKVVNKILDVY